MGVNRGDLLYFDVSINSQEWFKGQFNKWLPIMVTGCY